MSEEIVKNPPLDLRASYLAMIQNSVGTEIFRNRYYHIHGRSLDVLDDGDLACAVYVSSILYLFKLINEAHTTVAETIRDMEEMGWYKIPNPKEGAIILWDYTRLPGGERGRNRHIGFYAGQQSAISNSSKEKKTMRHHMTYGEDSAGNSARDILAFYWHKALG